jgi:hypothetical protein
MQRNLNDGASPLEYRYFESGRMSEDEADATRSMFRLDEK